MSSCLLRLPLPVLFCCIRNFWPNDRAAAAAAIPFVSLRQAIGCGQPKQKRRTGHCVCALLGSSLLKRIEKTFLCKGNGELQLPPPPPPPSRTHNERSLFFLDLLCSALLRKEYLAAARQSNTEIEIRDYRPPTLTTHKCLAPIHLCVTHQLTRRQTKELLQQLLQLMSALDCGASSHMI